MLFFPLFLYCLLCGIAHAPSLCTFVDCELFSFSLSVSLSLSLSASLSLSFLSFPLSSLSLSFSVNSESPANGNFLTLRPASLQQFRPVFPAVVQIRLLNAPPSTTLHRPMNQRHNRLPRHSLLCKFNRNYNTQRLFLPTPSC